ncbi:Uncharacterised protein [Zhongshania aliphaticivorans]|uniref:Uncharacterized protein n=1 Tax=Zhongshania aliphaticivorans TaxID=1470434 RepID=A0A5S9Q3B2_9GAMM|nr:Uncharacterised protein [Zhongshania aliphaticivorans]CAA0111716.1 Uncharacterised protein [Zhongshania aliphaticivorans]
MSKSYNKSKHSDLVKLSPFLFQKNRQVHQAGVRGVESVELLLSPSAFDGFFPSIYLGTVR